MTSRRDRQDRDTEPLADPEDDEDLVPDLYDSLRQAPWHGAYGERFGASESDSGSEAEERAPRVPWAELWPETEVPDTEVPETDWPEAAWPGDDEALPPEAVIDGGGDAPQEET